MNDRPQTSKFHRAIPAAAIVGVVAVLFVRSRSYGLPGWDTYPIIVSSRVQSLADFFGTFAERLMDGRYPGEFYRPLLNLTIAFDYALWGLRPLGYQLTNLLLFGGCAWALFALARRLMGAGALIGPLLTLGVFLLNPLHVEVLPVPARRPEVLCCLFMALALFLQLSPRALDSRRPLVWPALATLLALASKESAFVLPALIFLAVTLYSPRSGGLARLRHALSAVVPHLVALGLMILVRIPILGGLGGHEKLDLAASAKDVPRSVFLVIETLLFPQEPMRASILLRVVITLFVLGLVLATLLDSGGASGDTPATMPIEALAVGGAWILVFGLTYAAVGLIGPWYLFLPVAGWALTCGAVGQALAGWARSGSAALRYSSIVTGLLLAALLAWQTVYSPVLHRYDEWERAGRVAAEFFDVTARKLAETVDGSWMYAPPLPLWVEPPRSGTKVLGAAILYDYSVQAWADLSVPDRKVRVMQAETKVDPPQPDEVLVLLRVRLDGYESPVNIRP